MITNNHIIDEKIIKKNNNIIVSINDEKGKINIEINDNRKIYTNKKYDVTIIEIKEAKIKKFIELDKSIFNDNLNIFNENIYILQYPEYKYGEQIACLSVSYGILKGIKDKFNIIHLCSTKPGSSGSPILNILNNKVIGIHKETSKKYNCNIGTFLKFPIKEHLNNINIMKKEIKNIELKKEIKNNELDKEINNNEINNEINNIELRNEIKNNELNKEIKNIKLIDEIKNNGLNKVIKNNELNKEIKI